MKRIGFVSLAALIAIACGDEVPTEVGGSLTEGALRTYEVVLDPATFLAADTTYGGLRSPATVGFRLVAGSFEGQVNAHTLLRYSAPTSVTYTDSTDNSTTDTIPRFVGARLLLELDTSTTTAPAGSTLEAYTIVEEWHRVTASWSFRVDTTGARLPWTQPGGTTGMLLGTGVWEPEPAEDDTVGIDTVTVEIDSTGAVALADTVNDVDGILLRAGAPDTRYRIRSSRLFFQVRPLARLDTVIEVSTTQLSTFVFDPEQPDPGQGVVRVGGTPGWRAVFWFLPMMGTELDLGADCGAADCTVLIDEVTLNYAGLLLEPSYPGGFRPEAELVFEAREVLETPGVPLARSPLSASRSPRYPPAVPEDRFTASPGPGAVDVPITDFVRRLVDPDIEDEDRIRTLGLLPRDEGGTFGYTEFFSLETASPPRLRLVVSVVNPERIQ